MISKGIKIEPAHGKLGVVLPGMGTVSSTFIAGMAVLLLQEPDVRSGTLP